MGYILIVGAKSDIAKSVAREYAKLKYNLYLAARTPSELSSFANDLKVRTQIAVHLIQLDILDQQGFQTFYDSLEEKPVGVVLAVGYLGNQLTALTDLNETNRIIETNFTGAVRLLNVIANDFEQRKSGFIIGISSVAGDRGRKANYLYGSAKAGLTAYLSGLRNRLAASNVQVLTVKPGFVATKMTQGLDLPNNLTALPDQAAKDIVRAQLKDKNIIYIKGIWRWIMIVICLIPEGIFKRLSI